MASTLEQIYKEALALSDESKAGLAERLVEYLQSHVDPDLERRHLDTVKRRRDELRSGRVKPIDGDEALERARRTLRK